MAAYTAREAAFLSLSRIEAEKRYSNLELDAAIKKYALEGAEKKLYTVLVYGALERMLTLDFIIDMHLDERNRTIDPNLRVLLRIGAYQLLYTDRIPDSAAVNETVEICRKSPKLGIRPNISGASGLVNAVLRGIIRRRGQRGDGFSADTFVCSLLNERGIYDAERLSLRHSLGIGLCGLWTEAYGAEKVEAMMLAPMRHFTALRVNTLRMTAAEFCEKYAGKCALSPLSDVGVRWSGAGSEMLEAVECGDCFVEDESSQLTAAAVGAKSGMAVLDTCAAPGGKTFSLAMHMENSGRLLARDLHKNKLKLIEKGAARMGMTMIETAEADASDDNPELHKSFDRVLCDVPCSGSGVIFKKPELRYKDPSDYARLPDIQHAILSTCAAYVKDGGVLVYSTCALDPHENEDVVHRFVAGNGEFELEMMRTFFPDTDGTDGFFCAVMRRKQ